jgi:hypothetical protein
MKTEKNPGPLERYRGARTSHQRPANNNARNRASSILVMPILMPQWLHSCHPMAREAITEIMAAEFTRLMARDGLSAFEMPRPAAVAHEVGHALVETILGERVNSITASA